MKETPADLAPLGGRRKTMLVLASASPRRQELLKLITQEFIIVPVDIDESIHNSNECSDRVAELARRKARAALEEYPDDVVIGSDTLVSVNGDILGKPKDQGDAIRMLGMLSDSWHNVDTGVCVLSKEKEVFYTVNTKVKFVKLEPHEILSYVSSGEPMDKAGAYGIQGKGAKFISEIKGDFFAVMGLPVSSLYQVLKEEFIHTNI